MGKRGQIYIIASIILIAFIMGVVTISNTFQKIESFNIEKKSSELSFEIQRIFDSTHNQTERLERLISFADAHSVTTNIPTDFYFILKDERSSNFIIYDSSNKSLGLMEIGTDSSLDMKGAIKQAKTYTGSSYLVINTTNIVYNIPNIDEGNFHFIISREVKGERHILIK